MGLTYTPSRPDSTRPDPTRPDPTRLDSISPESARPDPVPADASAPLSEEDRSKDAFFVRLGVLAEEMTTRHGKDFAMGTLLLAARFIAENKPLGPRAGGSAPNQ